MKSESEHKKERQIPTIEEQVARLIQGFPPGTDLDYYVVVVRTGESQGRFTLNVRGRFFPILEDPFVVPGRIFLLEGKDAERIIQYHKHLKERIQYNECVEWSERG